MTDTRARILAALGISGSDAGEPAAAVPDARSLRARFNRPTCGPQPALPPHASLADSFCQRLEAAAGQCHRADEPAELVAIVRRLCPVPAEALVLAPDPALARLPWPADFTPASRAAGSSDSFALTRAWLGVAETGTLVLRAGPHTPTATNFLPDTLICVLERPRLVGHLEAVWEQQRREGLIMPRALNLITGPSRTADVEQSIQIGAHGPRQLHVILSNTLD